MFERGYVGAINQYQKFTDSMNDEEKMKDFKDYERRIFIFTDAMLYLGILNPDSLQGMMTSASKK